ncbi:MAG TPA: efflux RND transporter permease subunit, partial [Burkholderiaceae bacterium]|nr:efflux RND transporter permease subunit [Burkholderiaceae bacterium]
VPLALATGAGAESRRQIGMVIVGGMTLGTVLTLFVVPTVYTLMARRRRAPAAPAHRAGAPAAHDDGAAASASAVNAHVAPAAGTPGAGS